MEIWKIKNKIKNKIKTKTKIKYPGIELLKWVRGFNKMAKADVVQSAEEKEWAAKSDARTLAEANVILGDNKRLKAAKKAANNLAKEAKADFQAMLKVAGKGKTFEGMKVINRG